MKKYLILLIFLYPVIIYAQIVVNIVNYGAVADSTTNNSKAIQRAIDECYSKGGGTVFIPPGKYLTGSITLKNNINLYLEAGAVLVGSPLTADYPSIGMATEQRDNALIVAIGAQNISISGRGEIDGNGRKFINKTKQKDIDFDRHYTRQQDKFMSFNTTFPDGPYAMFPRPGVLILFINCNNVLLQDFTITDAPNWCLHLAGCRYVNIQSMNILNSLLIPNADGIDASNCQFVNINNCNIVAGDDGIAISPCADGYCSKKSENYTISNCNIVSRSSGIRVGYGTNDIRNLVFQNINITESNRGIGVYVRGKQNIENVLFSNVIIQTKLFNGPWWGNGDAVQVSAIPMSGKDTALGQIKNIRFSNINAEAENGILVYSSSPGHISLLTFSDVFLHIKNGGFTQAYGGNIDLRPAYNKAFSVFKHDVAGLYLYNVDRTKIKAMDLQFDKSLPGFFDNGILVEKSREVLIKDFNGKKAPNSISGKPIAIRNCRAVLVN